jgi:hypothetical protein
MDGMSIAQERQDLAGQLASVVGSTQAEIDGAILTEYERPPPERRNMVSVLASVAWLTVLLDSLSEGERTSWLSEPDDTKMTRFDRMLRGEIAHPAGELSEALAGPYDVSWDGNWPNPRPRLRGRMPPTVRPGDILIGGDGGGTRIDLRVVEDPDGVLTAEIVSQETWRDPPLEDVWIETYRRLASLYPEEVPQPGATP